MYHNTNVQGGVELHKRIHIMRVQGVAFWTFQGRSKRPNYSRFRSEHGEFPYAMGYSPVRWRNGVDVELLKKPGIYLLETFWTIQLFEPQFNANNKVLGRDTMAHSEKYNLIAEEQYGSRKHKLAIMHAVNKVLSFNIIHQYKILAALCCNDAKSCYDRMVHAVTSLTMQSKGVQEPPLVCMFTTLQNLNHTI